MEVGNNSFARIFQKAHQMAVKVMKQILSGNNSEPHKTREEAIFTVTDTVSGSCFGTFDSRFIGSVDRAELDAWECLSTHQSNDEVRVSPFIRYRHILCAGHGAAYALQNLALCLFTGGANKWDASSVSAMDREYVNVALAFIQSYSRYGESDKFFMIVCKDLLRYREGK